MRAEGALKGLAAAVWIFCAIPLSAVSPPPTIRVWRPAPADTSRASVAGPAASARAPLPTSTAKVPAAPPIDVVQARKIGSASLEDLLRLRRPVWLGALPLFGPTQGSLALPDGGGPIRLDGWSNEAERATDEPLLGSVALGWGAPWLAFSLDDPRADATETLDLDQVTFPSDRAVLGGPGETLTRPVPKGPFFAPSPSDTAMSRRSRTTLVFRKGDGDAQLTGARFQTSLFRRDFYASYSRNQANGMAPLASALSARYALRASLGRAAEHRIDVEGLLYERSIKDSVGGESEWDRRHLAVLAAREGTRSSDAFRVRIGTAKETRIVSPDASGDDAGSRERWEFPTIDAEGSVSVRSGSALTWIASGKAASRKIVFRVDSSPALKPRREDARLGLGARYALGPDAGAGIDAAYDMRETQPGFWDARASVWTGAARLRGRLDLESADQRPSWVDLLTPPVTHSYFVIDPVPLLTDISRSGDPGLRPRRLTGAITSVAFMPEERLRLEFSASYRRVTDDFGWDVSADTAGGIYHVSSVARTRGSGWLSHAGLAWEFRRGAIRTRGVGWVRGGSDSLSPRSGSPPRLAMDAAVDLRVILFHGDLPLRFGVESHARGPRKGLIREPAVATWDGSLSADFGPLGGFVRLHDLFDRAAGSAIWDPAVSGPAPMPGRNFQVGVAWNLLD